jgi:hypothetical protein
MIVVTVAILVATLNQKSPEAKGIAESNQARFIKEI